MYIDARGRKDVVREEDGVGFWGPGRGVPDVEDNGWDPNRDELLGGVDGARDGASEDGGLLLKLLRASGEGCGVDTERGTPFL